MRDIDGVLRSLSVKLLALKESGVLEAEQVEAAERCLRDLRHGFRVRDLKMVKKAITRIAKRLLR